ncbi:MAG: hypothetical protein EXQ52_03095 [Bryobacterales bacterium]|nr:hypothetical protein [Bryobacterales bacterium]
MSAATLASVMSGWRAGGMRRVHDFGVSYVISGVSGALAGSSPKFRTGMYPMVGLGIGRIEFSGQTRDALIPAEKLVESLLAAVPEAET